MTETMEQYMSKTRGNYGSGVARPKINDKTHFELKGQFLKELHENTFSSSEHEDANEHIEKVLEIFDLFHIPEVGCELCKGPHYTKNCPLKEEEKTLEEAYYTQFGAPYQPRGQYRAAGPGFYQCNNKNS
ncbi:formin-like protein 1 [Tanacetum coccineum]|uniref:Formin-like protein 1 n=1 Tax=Tanacetum coccineum TaxID=301880 RepID=A0ABQ5BBM0_9ASTR